MRTAMGRKKNGVLSFGRSKDTVLRAVGVLGLPRASRSFFKRMRLSEGSNSIAGGTLRTVISWIPLFTVCLYVLDYVETTIAFGLGMQEINPLMASLLNRFGSLGFSIGFLVAGVGMYVIAGQFRANPRLTTALVLIVGGYETVNVSMNLLRMLRI